MKITFEQSDNTIPLIAELPNYTRCRIEGKNGIGKSLAVRLLQLATGDQPYRAEPVNLWNSLRSALGIVTITATALRGASSVRWLLDPRKWPESPELPSDTWDGFKVTVDGTDTDIASIRRLIAVLRLDGSESVRDTIVARIRDVGGQVRLAADKLRDVSDSYASPLESLLSLSSGIDPQRINELRTTLADAQERLASTAEAEKRIQQRHRLLSEASEISAVIASGQLQGAIRERNTIDSALGELQGKLNELRGEAASLAAESRDPLREAIRRHERTVKRMTTRLDNLRADIEVVAERRGIDPEPSLVRKGLANAKERRTSLLESKNALGQLPQALEIGRRIEGMLTPVIRTNPSVPIAVISQQEITVADLARGVTKFREEASVRAAVDLDELDAEIREADKELADLAALSAALTDVPRVAKNLNRARSRLQEAVEDLDEADVRTAMEHNLKQQQAIADEIGRLNERRGYVAASIARFQRYGSEDEMQERLAWLLRTTDVEIDALEEARKTVFVQSTDLRDKLTELRQQCQNLSDDWELLQTRITSAIDALASPNFAWSRSLFGGSLPRHDVEMVLTAQQLVAINKAVARVDRALDGVRGLIDGAPEVVDRLATSIEQNKVPADQASHLYRAVRTHFEDLFATELGADRIAEELFEGSGDVGFDLERMEVSWSGQDGRLRVRPIEAFSSGERAWTYTLARLHDPVRKAANRLLVLDEFGAYIAADKLGSLERTLKAHIPGDIADQLLVILPLSSGWDQGLSKEETARRKDSVERHGYFASPMNSN